MNLPTFASRALPSLAEEYGVTLPASVEEARSRVAEIRKVNANPIPVRDFAREVVEADPKDLLKALDKAATRAAAEEVRGRLLDAVRRETEALVGQAVSQAREEIVSAFLTSPKVIAAAGAIAEHAPRLPLDTPRSPSLDRVAPQVVLSVAHVAAAWKTLGSLVRALDPILPGLPVEHAGPAFLLLDLVEYDSQAQAQAVATALTGRKPDAVSVVGVSLKTSTEADRRRGEVIPAVALAHVPGATLGLPSSRDEYAARVRAFADATTVGRWTDYRPQTPSSSWMPNRPTSGTSGGTGVL